MTAPSALLSRARVLQWHMYRQHNPGGEFDSSMPILLCVHAESTEAADARAVELGVYFKAEDDPDCECCGDRWYRSTGGEDEIDLDHGADERSVERTAGVWVAFANGKIVKSHGHPVRRLRPFELVLQRRGANDLVVTPSTVIVHKSNS